MIANDSLFQSLGLFSYFIYIWNIGYYLFIPFLIPTFNCSYNTHRNRSERGKERWKRRGTRDERGYMLSISIYSDLPIYTNQQQQQQPVSLTCVTWVSSNLFKSFYMSPWFHPSTPKCIYLIMLSRLRELSSAFWLCPEL